MLGAPNHASNKEYFQIEYFDDFEVLKRDKAVISLQVWKKNLDNPSEEDVLVETYPCLFEVGRQIWITNHIKLDIGWYDFVIKSDNEEIDTHEISVYESYDEEE